MCGPTCVGRFVGWSVGQSAGWVGLWSIVHCPLSIGLAPRQLGVVHSSSLCSRKKTLSPPYPSLHSYGMQVRCGPTCVGRFVGWSVGQSAGWVGLWSIVHCPLSIGLAPRQLGVVHSSSLCSRKKNSVPTIPLPSFLWYAGEVWSDMCRSVGRLVGRSASRPVGVVHCPLSIGLAPWQLGVVHWTCSSAARGVFILRDIVFFVASVRSHASSHTFFRAHFVSHSVSRTSSHIASHTFCLTFRLTFHPRLSYISSFILSPVCCRIKQLHLPPHVMQAPSSDTSISPTSIVNAHGVPASDVKRKGGVSTLAPVEVRYDALSSPTLIQAYCSNVSRPCVKPRTRERFPSSHFSFWVGDPSMLTPEASCAQHEAKQCLAEAQEWERSIPWGWLLQS